MRVSQELSVHAEEGRGVTLLTIPKGLNYCKLIAIAEEAEIPIKHACDLLKKIGNEETQEAYVVAIANSLFDGTVGKAFTKQKKYVEERGFHVADFINILALIILTYKCSPEEKKARLFHYYAGLECARTPQMIDGCRLVIGSFSSAGFGMYEDDGCLIYGAGGQWRF